MDFWDNVGQITWINTGETHHWTYGWGDWRPDVICLAGPDLDRNGSAGATVWATEQGKTMRIDNGPYRHEFHVKIRSDGPATAVYNLQVVMFS
jgi:hypothetical protein